MIENPDKKISVCIFGSSARASADAISDRDVLIVAANAKDARDTVNGWEAAGWSVSFYTRTRLRKVAQAGSLFVKHLQLEGTIVADPSGWLANTLAQYRVKRSYSAEIEDALHLALPLQRLNGSSPFIAPALAADIGYVFLRNYAIYRCAEAGTYLFDYAALLEELQSLEGFSDRCRTQLMELRLGKHLHRSGYSALRNMSGMKNVTQWIAEACPSLSIDPIAPDTPIRTLATQYSTLRDCEAAFAVHGLLEKNHHDLPQPIEKIWRMIRSPKDYSWHVTKIDETWVEGVNTMIAEFTSARSSQEPPKLVLQRFGGSV
jgi:hypothetical protein